MRERGGGHSGWPWLEHQVRTALQHGVPVRCPIAWPCGDAAAGRLVAARPDVIRGVPCARRDEARRVLRRDVRREPAVEASRRRRASARPPPRGRLSRGLHRLSGLGLADWATCLRAGHHGRAVGRPRGRARRGPVARRGGALSATRDADLGSKMAEYATAGAPWYWTLAGPEDRLGISLVVWRNGGAGFVEVQRIQGRSPQRIIAPIAIAMDPQDLFA